MTTRSTKLWAQNVAQGLSLVVFTAPSSTVTLLKSFQIYNPGPDPTVVTFFLMSYIGSVGVVLHNDTLTVGGLFEWNGWMVLNPLDHVEIFSNTAPVRSWGSGAFLPPSPT